MSRPLTGAMLLLGFGLFVAPAGRAAEPNNPPPGSDSPATATGQPITDPAQAAARFQQVLQRPEFQQMEEDADPDLRFKDWLSQWFTYLGTKLGQLKYADEMPRFASLLLTLLVVLSIVALLYIAGRFLRQRRHPGFPERAEEPRPGISRPPEYDDDEIIRARAAGDWHAAWLATWRQFLSRMENRRLVEADRTRTNREYLGQLRAHSLPASAWPLLIQMADAYDQFIYGRRRIAEADWALFQQQAREAALLLHLDDKTRPLSAARPSA